MLLKHGEKPYVQNYRHIGLLIAMSRIEGRIQHNTIEFNILPEEQF